MEHYMSSKHTQELMTPEIADQWLEKTVPEMEHILSILANNVASNMLDPYRKYLPTIPMSSPSVIGAELPEGVAARSDRGPIELNTTTTLMDRDDATSIAVHEAVHHMQNFVAKYAPEHKEKEMDLMRASLLSHNGKLFDVPMIGQIYVNPRPTNIRPNSKEERLRETIYAMCFIERQAREEQYRFMTQFGLNTYDLECYNAQVMDDFREIYNCPKLGNQTISDIVDAAQLHILNQTMPQPGTKYASLTASVMYDFAVLTYGQNMQIQKHNMAAGKNHDLIRRQLCDPMYKAEKLSKFGYEYSMTYDLDKAQALTLTQIKNMSQKVRDANPHVMVYAVINEENGHSALDLINWESFDKWYFDSDNPMGPKTMGKFAAIAGEKYSVQNRNISLGEQEIDILSLQDQPPTQEQQQAPGSDKR